ncbi:MAG: tetratricopeptide repeat protein [Chitinispirillaceae bacterium]
MNKLKTLSVLFILLIRTATMAQSSAESLMSNGQELLQRGAYSQAVTAFKQVLAREPDFFEAQFNLGFAYLQWGNNAQAVVELKKALKLQPKNSEAWSNLAIAYDNLNRSNDAMEALAQAVNCNPENMTARMNLAAMYANANHMQQAIAQYRQITAMDSANNDALSNLAKCLVAAGTLTEAKEVLKKVIAAEPGKGEPHSELGDIYWKKENDVDKAMAEYRTAISLEPNNPQFYQDLAMALEHKGQKQEAIETWKKAVTYIDDALNKEKILDRIDRLEKSTVTTPGFGGAPVDTALSRKKTEDLKRELRPETTRKDRKLIDAPPPDVSSDLDQMNADSSSWDLTKEAKKRVQDRKSAAGK